MSHWRDSDEIRPEHYDTGRLLQTPLFSFLQLVITIWYKLVEEELLLQKE
jgi:hypothetical protein